MLNGVLRPQLLRMLSWYIGLEQNFQVSVGKSGKYMYRYLSQKMWQRYLTTYAGWQIEEVWHAADVMCRLFDETARAVAAAFAFLYREMEAENSYAFFCHVKTLPQDAMQIY